MLLENRAKLHQFRILESHKQLAPTCTICANDKQRRHIQTAREQWDRNSVQENVRLTDSCDKQQVEMTLGKWEINMPCCSVNICWAEFFWFAFTLGGSLIANNVVTLCKAF